jgi:hypothetical protein
MASFNLQSFLSAHVTITYIHGVVLPLHLLQPPLLPLLSPLLPFVLPFTYLAPSSCDRNRPPSYQVACRLTPFAPPFTQLSHPFQIPRTPIAPRLTTTTLGPLRSDYAEQYIIILHLQVPLQNCHCINLKGYSNVIFKLPFFDKRLTLISVEMPRSNLEFC